MHIVMSAKEQELLLAFIRNSRRYVEFGSGGSTNLAAQHVKETILSVDSDAAWLEKVAAACAPYPVKPQLVAADIGPTGNWGYPTDAGTRGRWPDYHEGPWALPGAGEADLYLVDGRFRVACFAQVILHCGPGAVVGIHDFADRPQYHAVREIAREIATVENLSFFLPRPGAGPQARAILEAHRFTPE
jgi:hypothetical protein